MATTAGSNGLPTLFGSTAAIPLAGAGLNFLGSYLQGRSETNNANVDRYLAELARVQGNQLNQNSNTANALMTFLNGQMTDRLNRNQQGMAATQLDPYVEAKSANGLNVRRSYAAGLDPSSGRFSGSIDTSALDPSRLQDARNDFDLHRAALDPETPILNGSGRVDDLRNGFLGRNMGQAGDLLAQIISYLQRPATAGVSVDTRA